MLTKLELELIWYEYGQVMNKIYSWTNYLEKEKIIEQNRKSSCYNFNVFMQSNCKKKSFHAHQVLCLCRMNIEAM
jgi:hypothetical protein